eukprot:10859710-Karenia_brevis.AAC.2
MMVIVKMVVSPPHHHAYSRRGMPMSQAGAIWSQYTAAQKQPYVDAFNAQRAVQELPPERPDLPAEDTPLGIGDADYPVSTQFLEPLGSTASVLRGYAKQWSKYGKAVHAFNDLPQAAPRFVKCGDLYGPGKCATDFIADKRECIQRIRLQLCRAASNLKDRKHIVMLTFQSTIPQRFITVLLLKSLLRDPEVQIYMELCTDADLAASMAETAEDWLFLELSYTPSWSGDIVTFTVTGVGVVDLVRSRRVKDEAAKALEAAMKALRHESAAQVQRKKMKELGQLLGDPDSDPSTSADEFDLEDDDGSWSEISAPKAYHRVGSGANANQASWE